MYYRLHIKQLFVSWCATKDILISSSDEMHFSNFHSAYLPQMPHNDQNSSCNNSAQELAHVWVYSRPQTSLLSSTAANLHSVPFVPMSHVLHNYERELQLHWITFQPAAAHIAPTWATDPVLRPSTTRAGSSSTSFEINPSQDFSFRSTLAQIRSRLERK